MEAKQSLRERYEAAVAAKQNGDAEAFRLLQIEQVAEEMNQISFAADYFAGSAREADQLDEELYAISNWVLKLKEVLKEGQYGEDNEDEGERAIIFPVTPHHFDNLMRVVAEISLEDQIYDVVFDKVDKILDNNGIKYTYYPYSKVQVIGYIPGKGQEMMNTLIKAIVEISEIDEIAYHKLA